jgi:8-oxo-dGTP diphosphatase
MSYTYAYPRANICVDVIASTGYEVLLIKRKNAPFKGKWALPGGYIEIGDDETVREAARRELKEETRLSVENAGLVFLGFYDAPKRDPRSRTISFVFFNHRISFPQVKAGDDAKEAKWFKLKKLPRLAFDHRQIMDDYIGRFKF